MSSSAWDHVYVSLLLFKIGCVAGKLLRLQLWFFFLPHTSPPKMDISRSQRPPLRFQRNFVQTRPFLGRNNDGAFLNGGFGWRYSAMSRVGMDVCAGGEIDNFKTQH